MTEYIDEYPAAASQRPAPRVGMRKAVKYALVRWFGAPMERLFFEWRLLLMRVKSLMGRPYAALYGMDRRLEKYLGFEGGVFIEAGANDGIAQSNTYFLEKKYGWSGVLIEPVPKYYRMCRRSRRATAVNCALGTFASDGQELTMLAGGLMSLPLEVDESLLHGRSAHEHAAFGAREFGARRPETVRTPIRALSRVLDEAGVTRIDFFSLDVEGFELEVLRGLDLQRHRPEFLLIETEQFDAVEQFLAPHYSLVETLSHHDFLFRCHRGNS